MFFSLETSEKGGGCLIGCEWVVIDIQNCRGGVLTGGGKQRYSHQWTTLNIQSRSPEWLKKTDAPAPSQEQPRTLNNNPLVNNYPTPSSQLVVSDKELQNCREKSENIITDNPNPK